MADGTMVVVRESGEIVEEEEQSGPTLSVKIHEALDDYFEMVPRFTQYKGRRCVAFCGEHGKARKPPNAVATTMWRMEYLSPDWIAGPMVIVFGSKEFMRQL